ncbi:hypothetical protein HPY16_14475 [Vibrio cholerae]|uniref:hypothetical protein n=1 Tax=Vibrio cholerae TaxID=666 RepID=UPI001583DD56|nr:hypothetical protein [Vibrio cholerae]QKU90880.1 hypothetical protein HPY16_14475 [Vibrio cholerae]
MSVLLTVVSGFLVFVLGQFVLKLVLEPIVSFKEALGSLSAFCLKNRAKITNANASTGDQSELRQIISTILSKKEAIPFYSKVARLLKLPSEVNLLKACMNLNFVAYEMCKDTATHKTDTVGCTKIVMELHVASNLLDLRLDFETL